MALPALTIDDTPSDILGEHVHCRTTLTADPLASALAPAFDGLIVDWKQVHMLSIQIEIDLAQAVAKAFYVDSSLNGFVDRLVVKLDEITKKDRTDPLWKVYFKGQPPSSFKRPILGGQLASMRLWPPVLSSSPQQALVDLAPELTPLLAAGTTAEQDVANAKQALVTFRNAGSWRKHVDQANATRATAYGALLEIPHQNPDLKLSADYADLFFLHDTSRRGASKPRSSAEIAAEIAALQAKLPELEAALKAATEREQAASAREAQRQEDEKQLAAVKQQEKEARDKKKALTKKLGKK